ncbi:cupin domain-containing protein [Tolypothrix sp. FACHB-123]|uniref:cupin domain-containing protein n=1 Tax=Tolypothrix sp. FACHB-123 TaxID=2692868 RepID=UPI001683607C|nr:cupin domain-containing protein [Tolypothrix sp. FACHB-123]MBD2355923.1 cupin domain-containing protein [Tolypothrix sp. FACHB-123]
MASIMTINQALSIQIKEQIEYPHSGVLSKILLKDNVCQYTLFCLAANTEISEHTSTRNATIYVISGKGLLNLSGQEIVLEPGIFVFMPANATHALQAEENLAFLLILFEKVADND